MNKTITRLLLWGIVLLSGFIGYAQDINTIRTESWPSNRVCVGERAKINVPVSEQPPAYQSYTYQYWDGASWVCCFGTDQTPYELTIPATGQLVEIQRKYTNGQQEYKRESVGFFYTPLTPSVDLQPSQASTCDANGGSIRASDISANFSNMTRRFYLYNAQGTEIGYSDAQSTASYTFNNLAPGTYRVKISTGCTQAERSVVISDPNFDAKINGSTQLCLGTGTTLIATGGGTYLWSNGATSSSITVLPSTPGLHNYSVQIKNGTCSRLVEHQIQINAAPGAQIDGPSSTCYNGSVTLTASGSGSYKWSTGANTSSISTSLLQNTQTYRLTITNPSTQCSSTDEHEVTVLPRPTLNEAPNSICAGGTVNLSVSGGSSYSWNVGGTTASIQHSPSSSTEYRVTVTDASGCSYVLSKSINVSSPLNITFGGGTSICAGQSLNITAFGGSTYSWSHNSANTATITVSPTVNTTYTVTATSGGGCVSTAERVITVKPSPTGDIDAPSSICPGQSVSLIATGGGTYLWNVGNATTASITVSPTQNTNYTVSISNIEGCTVVKSHAIAVNISGSASNDGPLTCSKTSAILIGTSSAQGASYHWKNASGVTIANTANTTVTTAGVYTLEISAAGGCMYSTATEVLQDLQTPSVSASNSGAITCTQSSVNLLGTSSVSPASYEWRNGSGTLIASTLNTNVTQAGTYTLKVTAANGCSSTASTVVMADLILPQVNVQHDGALTCTKPTAVLSAGSSTAGLQYTWKNAAGNTLGTGSSIQVSASGSYWLEARGTNGCMVSQSIALTQSGTLPNVSVSKSTSGCNFTLQGSSTTAGVTYAWTNQNGRVVATTPNFTTNQAGTYTLKVSLASGCSNQASINTGSSGTTVSISIDGASQGYLTYHKANLTCTKNSVVLSASSADQIESYYWKSPSGAYLKDGSSLTVTQTGTYLLVAGTETGCPQTHEVLVERINTMPAVQITGDSTVCRYSSTTLSAYLFGASSYQWSNGSTDYAINTGSVDSDVIFTVTVTMGSCQRVLRRTVRVEGQAPMGSTAGPTKPCTHVPVTYSAGGGSTYKWSSGETTATISVPNGFTNTNWVNYWVDISDQYGCTTRRSFTVKPTGSPVVTVNGAPTAPFCAQATVNLTTNTGGAWGNYLWSTGETTANLQKTLNESTNLTLKFTASNGCVITKSIPVEVVPRPTPQILGGDIACAGDNTTLRATGGNTYLWSTTATTSSISINQPTQSQTYTVTVSSIPGCTAAAFKVVTVPAPLSLSHDLAGDDDCIPNNVAVIPTVSGGTGSISLGLIRSGELYVSTNLSGLNSGTYLLRAEDTRGCIALDEVVIAETPVKITHTDLSNLNDCTPNNVSLNVVASGSKLPFSYRLNGSTMTGTSATVPSGTHFIEVQDAIGCIARDTVTVDETLQLQFQPELQPATCFGGADGSIVIEPVQGHSGVAPYTYLWSTGATSSTITQLAAGTYSVTITDARGCTAVLSGLVITQPSELVVEVEIIDSLSCFGSSNAAVIATVSGGTAPYTYTWSTGASTTSIEGLSSGTYTVTVVDNQGCEAIGTVTIVNPPQLMLSYTLSGDTLDCVRGNVQVQLSSTGARGTVSYHFDTPQSALLSPAEFNSSSMRRWVYAVDTVGCVDSVEVLVRDTMPGQVNSSRTTPVTSTAIASSGTPASRSSLTPVQQTCHSAFNSIATASKQRQCLTAFNQGCTSFAPGTRIVAIR